MGAVPAPEVVETMPTPVMTARLLTVVPVAAVAAVPKAAMVAMGVPTLAQAAMHATRPLWNLA